MVTTVTAAAAVQQVVECTWVGTAAAVPAASAAAAVAAAPLVALPRVKGTSSPQHRDQGGMVVFNEGGKGALLLGV
jgi:hypothetical protein